MVSCYSPLKSFRTSVCYVLCVWSGLLGLGLTDAVASQEIKSFSTWIEAEFAHDNEVIVSGRTVTVGMIDRPWGCSILPF